MIDDDFAYTRPLAGTNVRLSMLRLRELFFDEQSEELHNALLRLFPSLRRDSNNFSDDFDEETGSVGAGSWRRIGTLMRSLKGWIALDETTEMSELPDYIDRVDVGLFRTLHSFRILTLDVRLSQSAWDSVQTVQDTKPAVAISFSLGFPPWKPPFSASYGSGQIAIEKAVISHIQQVRSEVEACLRPYFSGYFSRRSTCDARLPWTECFLLTGAAGDAGHITKWIRDTVTWRSTVGLDLVNAYFSEDSIWAPPIRRKNREPAKSQLLLLTETALSENQLQGYGGSLAAAAPEILTNALDEFVTASALADYLLGLESEVAAHYSTVRGSYAKADVGLIARRHDDVRQSALRLEQVLFDMRERLTRLQAGLNAATNNMRMRTMKGLAQPQPIGNQIYLELKRYGEGLLDRLTFLRTTNMDYLQSKNIEFTARLMRRTYIATVAAVFASIVAVLAALATNWGSTKAIFYDVQSYITNSSDKSPPALHERTKSN